MFEGRAFCMYTLAPAVLPVMVAPLELLVGP